MYTSTCVHVCIHCICFHSEHMSLFLEILENFTNKLIYRLTPLQALTSATTSTGPAPFPRSSARLKKANAVPTKLIIIH